MHRIVYLLLISWADALSLAAPALRRAPPVQRAVHSAPQLQRTQPPAMQRTQPPAMQADGRRVAGDWAVPAIACQPVMYWSLYTLKTTGCGLPAGPFGLFGAAEGISYLIVAGVVIASLGKKVTTGSGFEDEPGSLPLKGLAEGLCFLTAVVGLAVLGLQIADYGFVPEAVPVEGGRCSNIG